MDSTDYVTISAAAALVGVPEQTVQQWIAAGKVQARAGNRGRLVRLVDVERLLASEDTTPGTRAASVEGGAAATPSQDVTLDEESSATDLAARAMARSAALGHLRTGDGNRVSFMARLDELYRAQVATRDQEIAELHDRLERAEQALAETGRTEATSEPAGAPPDSSALTQATSEPVGAPPDSEALAEAGRTEATSEPVKARPDSKALTRAAVRALIAKLDELYGEQIAARDDHIATQEALIAKLDQLYAEQSAAKDSQIAALEELVAELRRRAEYAERQAGMIWEHEAPPEPGAVVLRPQQTTLPRSVDEERPGEPAAVSVRRPPAREVRARSGRPARAGRRRWALVVPALAIILIGVVLSQVLAREAPTGTHPTFTQFAPIVGLPWPVATVLAQDVGLVGPRKAVPLPHGQIAVADTGNQRLVLLDPAGHLSASVHAGGLRQPVAVVAAAGSLYVLDAARGAIERYDTAGRYVGQIIRDPRLVGGRALTQGQGGLLYVANPGSNAIVVLSAQGKILYRITSPRGSGKGQLDGPADVAVGPGGNLYVADSANNRIEVLSPSGTFVAQWPAPRSTPQQPLQVAPLPDGSVLAADPAGGLLVYTADSALPVFRRPLQLPAGQRHAVEPSGLSPLAGGAMLVSDARGNRLLVVRLPR